MTHGNELWSTAKIVCGNHEGPDYPTMKLEGGQYLLYYQCTCFDYSGKYGNVCKNRISLTDYESILDKLSMAMNDTEAPEEFLNLTNFRWHHKTLSCEVVKHSTSETVIKVVNEKALGR